MKKTLLVILCITLLFISTYLQLKAQQFIDASEIEYTECAAMEMGHLSVYCNTTVTVSIEQPGRVWIKAMDSGTGPQPAAPIINTQVISSKVFQWYDFGEQPVGTYDIVFSNDSFTDDGDVNVAIDSVKVVQPSSPPAEIDTFFANELKFSWSVNTEVDLAGYRTKIYTDDGAVTVDPLSHPLISEDVVQFSQPGHWWFAVAALDTAGNSSAYTAIQFYLRFSVPDRIPPEQPGGLRIESATWSDTTKTQ